MLTLNRILIIAVLGAVCLLVVGVKSTRQSEAQLVLSEQVQASLLAASSKPIRNIRKKMNEKPCAQVAKA